MPSAYLLDGPISGDSTKMSFESLGLRTELLRAASEKGYSTPTPIQTQAIPPILEGRDLMGGAQTGTGKPLVLLCRCCKD